MERDFRQAKPHLFGLCCAYIQETFIFVIYCYMTSRGKSVFPIIYGILRLRTVCRCVKQHIVPLECKGQSSQKESRGELFCAKFCWGLFGGGEWVECTCVTSCCLRFSCELRYCDQFLMLPWPLQRDGVQSASKLLGQPKRCSEPEQSKQQLKERNQTNGLVCLKCTMLSNKN